MIKKTAFFILILIYASLCYSQSSPDDLNSIGLPSPNNTFLGATNDISENLYTGTPQTNIPIYVLDSKDLKIPIELSYVNGSGLKVQDYSNFVGLGWELNAGGCITRIVRGLPDEQPNGYIGTTPSGTNVNAASSTTPSYSLISQLGKGQIDGEPDIFNIRTPFFNIQFVFDQNGVPVFHGNPGFSISHHMLNNSNYSSTSWIVTDDKGNQFFFGSTPGSRESQTNTLFGNSKNYISTWYLDKIVTYNSKDVITFSYISGSDYSVNHFLWTQTNFSTSPNCSIGSPLNTSYTQTTTYNSPKYVNQIVSSLGEVDFNYIADRQDFTSAMRLSSILVKSFNPITQTNNNSLRSYNFNYSYFGAGSTDINQLRLRLDNITLSGNTSSTSNLNLYSFGYNVNVNLPPRNSVQFDYWGYYNSNTATTPIVPVANRAPDINRATANILTSITNLSGGTTNFQYESNMFYTGTSNIYGGGLRIHQISNSLPTGESTFKQYFYSDINGNSTGQINNQYYQNFNSNINVLFYNGSNSCAIAATNTSSESIFNSYNLDGYFVGYSSVKVLNQNGGYEIDKFTNFSDFPDVFNSNNTNASAYSYSNSRQLSCATSLNYKRGLLLDRTLYALVNGQINKVSEISDTYSTIGNISNSSFAIRANTFTYFVGADISAWLYGTYQFRNENYLKTSEIVYDYDQKNPTNFIMKTTNFNYILNSNYHTVFEQNIATTDSKGLTYTKTFYHANDASIPMVTPGEQTAITAMANANRTSVLVHETDVRNGITTQIHNSYTSGNFNINNGFANTYLANVTSYNSSTQVSQQLFNYDGNNSNLISSSQLGGKSTSLSYGYNSSYPVAKIVNGTSTVSYSNQTIAQTGILNIPPNTWGGQTLSFTNSSPGTITVSMPPGSYLGGSVTCYFAFSLTGPSNVGGNLCNNSKSGYTCSAPNTVSFSNMPAGNYTLTVTAYTNTATTTVPVNVVYTGTQVVATPYSEFFFEGFEENAFAVAGNAHTGNMYWNTNYTVSYSPPNSRSYIIQYWNLSGGIWNFNEAPYTVGMTLTGPVDDIRVFPADALMTSYTYNPLVGMTSETDPSGKSIIYQYDGLGRLQTVRDQDNNILKQYDYEYQVPAKPGSTLGMTGTPGFSSTGPTTGQGTIFGPPGYLVTVTMTANGSPGYNYGLNVQINGVTITGPTSVTNGTASFTFTLPPSGVVGWSASFVPTGGSGGGGFSIH